MSYHFKTPDEVKDFEEDVEYIRFEMTDLHGISRSKTVPARHRNKDILMYSGTLLLGPRSSPTITQEVLKDGCNDLKLIPDWNTFRVIPWVFENPTARVLCEQSDFKNKRLQVHPRTVCKNVLDELRQLNGAGYELLSAHDLEFTLMKFDEAKTARPAFEGCDAFASLQMARVQDLSHELERNLLSVGIDVHALNAGRAPGQMELACISEWGLQGADNAYTCKNAIKEICQKKARLATFMCKPFADSGDGATACNDALLRHSLWRQHPVEGPTLGPNSPPEPVPEPTAAKQATRLSFNSFAAGLTFGVSPASRTSTSRTSSGSISEAPQSPPPPAESERMQWVNVFSDKSETGCSPECRWWVGGLLKHGNALRALTAPTVNCYERPASGKWVPLTSACGWNGDAAQVSMQSNGLDENTSVSMRHISAAANPYLVVAGIAAAGMDGLRCKLEPPEEAWKAPCTLACGLEAALQALESDAVLVAALGSQFVDWFVRVKRDELAHFSQTSTDSAAEKAKAHRDLYAGFI
ncbi:hypothetical protein CYMTET_34630 [Cymbomonas tetramitiformis]|uniref:Lengsin n=1 Tax=Cymbomonas tetramitiformis TaxID=36881 RepID=A0AAE0FAP3_9CHLO|nr:hypothetical protein CYMTET_34630 [Cymbomonas tetramitiformis]